MKTYEFKSISSYVLIGSLIVLTLGLISISLGIFGKQQGQNALFSTVLTLVVAFFISKEIAKGKVKITLTESELDIKWLRKPLISFQKSKKIKISDISGWRYRPDNNFDMLKIYLETGQDIKFERINFWSTTKDDFGKFYGDLEKLVNIENKKRKKTKRVEIIDKEVEYYKSEFAELIYYFGILLCIAGVLIILFSKNLDLADIFILLACMSGGLVFIMRFRKMNKK